MILGNSGLVRKSDQREDRLPVGGPAFCPSPLGLQELFQSKKSNARSWGAEDQCPRIGSPLAHQG